MSNTQQNNTMSVEKAVGMISRMMNQITAIVIGLEDSLNARDTEIVKLREILAEITASKNAKVPNP